MKIISDSSSNVTSVAGIDFKNVPLKIISDTKEYVDDMNLDVGQMVEELAASKGRITTSCPNAHEWAEAYGVDENDDIFAVTISSNLSGSCQAAKIAAMQFENRNVHVVDSLSAGPSLGLIIEKLEELIKAGLSFEEIKEKIDDYQKHTHLVFDLMSLNNLANNGRVSHIVAAAAGVLGIHLIGVASDEGRVEPKDKARGKSKVLAAILKQMEEKGYMGGKVKIDHVINLSAATTLKDKLLERYPNANIAIGECRGLCGFYAEKGGLMIAFEDE